MITVIMIRSIMDLDFPSALALVMDSAGTTTPSSMDSTIRSITATTIPFIMAMLDFIHGMDTEGSTVAGFMAAAITITRMRYM